MELRLLSWKAALARSPYSSSNDGSRRKVEAGKRIMSMHRKGALCDGRSAGGCVKGEREGGREGKKAGEEKILMPGGRRGLARRKWRISCKGA